MTIWWVPINSNAIFDMKCQKLENLAYLEPKPGTKRLASLEGCHSPSCTQERTEVGMEASKAILAVAAALSWCLFSGGWWRPMASIRWDWGSHSLLSRPSLWITPFPWLQIEKGMWFTEAWSAEGLFTDFSAQSRRQGTPCSRSSRRSYRAETGQRQGSMATHFLLHIPLEA